jgi:hypothetical protein
MAFPPYEFVALNLMTGTGVYPIGPDLLRLPSVALRSGPDVGELFARFSVEYLVAGVALD